MYTFLLWLKKKENTKTIRMLTIIIVLEWMKTIKIGLQNKGSNWGTQCSITAFEVKSLSLLLLLAAFRDGATINKITITENLKSNSSLHFSWPTFASSAGKSCATRVPRPSWRGHTAERWSSPLCSALPRWSTSWAWVNSSSASCLRKTTKQAPPLCLLPRPFPAHHPSMHHAEDSSH